MFHVHYKVAGGNVKFELESRIWDLGCRLLIFKS